MVGLSFNESKYFNQWTGFTLQWYEQLFQNQNILNALYNSMIVAVVSTFLSILFGFGIALYLFRVKNRFTSFV